MNQLCDLSLVYAFAEGRIKISALLVAQVLKDRNAGQAIALFQKEAQIVPMVKADVADPVPAGLVNDGLLPERA
jgi:hypothetical protein